MADKLMFIPKDDTQMYPFGISKLVVETFQRPTNEPTYQNSLMSRKSG